MIGESLHHIMRQMIQDAFRYGGDGTAFQRLQNGNTILCSIGADGEVSWTIARPVEASAEQVNSLINESGD